MAKEKKEQKEQKKKLEIEKGKTFLGLEMKHLILLFSGMLSIIFVFLALIVGKEYVKFYGLFVGLAVTIAFVPYSLYSYAQRKRVVDMEANLPSFLRDIAEARKSGMTLPQAVYKSSQVDYGKLSPEVVKMANQISWGVPFNEVLFRFSKRCGSKFIQRSIAIIVEAQVSGGALEETLDAVARDARMIKDAEEERKSKLSQQAMIMYAIYFLFVAIVVALQRLMIPLISSRGFSLAASNPEEILTFYRNLFFSMIVIQAVFNGMLAGQIAEGSPVIGLKHSAIFLVVGVFISWIAIF